MKAHPVDPFDPVFIDPSSGSPRSPRRLSPATAIAALMLAGALPCARAEPAAEFAAASIDQLKVAYLGCSRSALDGGLSKPGIMRCSILYEELKRRAFDGDFDRLLAWSRAQQSAHAAERSQRPADLSVAEETPSHRSRQP
jgi:hypothetical protein